MFSAFQTFGKLGALASSVARAWSPLALWPDGIASPGMWISPRDLTSQWADYTGTTPVSVPGTVADSSNPVGLALDIRAGAPEVLGPELVTDGWAPGYQTPAISVSGDRVSVTYDGGTYGRATSPIVCVIGRQYRVSITLVSSGVPVLRAITTQSAGVIEVAYTDSTTPGTWSAVFTATDTTLWVSLGLQGASAGQTGVFEGVTCKEVPGNHMLQSTSPARPVLSARVNTLYATQDFSHAAWVVDEYGTGTLTKTLGQTDPNGGSTAVRLLSVTDGLSNSTSFRFNGVLQTEQVIRSFYIKSNTGVGYSVDLGDTSITLVADTEYHRYDVSESAFSWGTRISFDSIGTTDITVAFAQRELGTSLSDYQSVTYLPDDERYPSAGFPIAQKYDGVDDGMATAAFAAGTLTSAMDCLIPVRRDSAASCVAGLYNGIADATKFFGMAESASGSGCVGSGAGTPTVWVDNTQLTGGTAVTRGTLHTALTVGDWHILEFRNLDLSTWTAAGFGLYTSYLFPGPRGDILLFPSTASTEDKDAARQWLADYYGVTLP